MIKSDAQRERTVAQIEGFRQALARAELDRTGKRAKAIRGSYNGMIQQLEQELGEYDELKSGTLILPDVYGWKRSLDSSPGSGSRKACRKRSSRGG